MRSSSSGLAQGSAGTEIVPYLEAHSAHPLASRIEGRGVIHLASRYHTPSRSGGSGGAGLKPRILLYAYWLPRTAVGSFMPRMMSGSGPNMTRHQSSPPLRNGDSSANR